jgi:hypothetical protein
MTAFSRGLQLRSANINSIVNHENEPRRMIFLCMTIRWANKQQIENTICGLIATGIVKGGCNV